ncbi:hypothetical protein MTR_4g007650 [Medicago truncatula]|uniref:Uncharacterized protein n=1 Tax=Medicago truncatula TaxID=3880 RepID=A0A072UFW3_MEDTR|nr:hypothetical protein MTR_4g007650 [Medicago truncatula]
MKGVSRSPSSTGKCRNCKAGRHDLGSNPGPHSCVCYEVNPDIEVTNRLNRATLTSLSESYMRSQYRSNLVAIHMLVKLGGGGAHRRYVGVQGGTRWFIYLDEVVDLYRTSF